MAEHSDKFLSFDKFKEQVYKNIGSLETMDETDSGKILDSEKSGCLGFFMIPLVKNLTTYANKKQRESWKYGELEEKADEILADRRIRDLLCEKLDATVVLPIDAAYKITPVLYGLALEDEEKVPFNTRLFAIISRKIVKQGVENYCEAKPRRGKKSGEKNNHGD